jgi:hypothetical protein
MLPGTRLQDRPEGETVEDRSTVPVKLFTGTMVMFEVALEPAIPNALVGLAVMLKSWFVMVTVAV